VGGTSGLLERVGATATDVATMSIVPGFQEFFDSPVALLFKAIAHGVQVSAGVTVEKIVIEAENSLGSL
jgi:hypothetical protein